MPRIPSRAEADHARTILSAQCREKRRALAPKVIAAFEAGMTMQMVNADPSLPSAASIRSWINHDPEIAAAIKAARRNVGGRYPSTVWSEVLERLRRGELPFHFLGKHGLPTSGAVESRRRRDPEFDRAYAAAVPQISNDERCSRARAGRRAKSLAKRAGVIDAVVAAMARGMSFSKACREAGALNKKTVRQWCAADPVLAEKIHAARATAAGTYRARYADWDQLLRRLAEGEPLSHLWGRDGMPRAGHIRNRRLRDPEFAARLDPLLSKHALTGRGRTPRRYGPAVRAAILAAAEGGASYREIVERPDLPPLVALQGLRDRDRDFRDALDAALLRNGHRPRHAQWNWDGFLQQLQQGGTLSGVAGRGDMPSLSVYHRRREQDPEFARAAQEAWVAGSDRRVFRVTYSPDQFEAALRAIQGGVSRESLGRLGLPGRKAMEILARRDPDFRRRLEVARQYRGLYEGPVGSRLNRALSQNEVYAAVNAALPRGLDPSAREDVRSEMILAVLAGDIELGDVARQARAFISRHYRGSGQRSVSFDAPDRYGRSRHELIGF